MSDRGRKGFHILSGAKKSGTYAASRKRRPQGSAACMRIMVNEKLSDFLGPVPSVLHASMEMCARAYA